MLANRNMVLHYSQPAGNLSLGVANVSTVSRLFECPVVIFTRHPRRRLCVCYRAAVFSVFAAEMLPCQTFVDAAVFIFCIYKCFFFFNLEVF